MRVGARERMVGRQDPGIWESAGGPARAAGWDVVGGRSFAGHCQGEVVPCLSLAFCAHSEAQHLTSLPTPRTGFPAPFPSLPGRGSRAGVD